MTPTEIDAELNYCLADAAYWWFLEVNAVNPLRNHGLKKERAIAKAKHLATLKAQVGRRQKALIWSANSPKNDFNH